MNLSWYEELILEVSPSILETPCIYKLNSAIQGENKEGKKSRKWKVQLKTQI